jgi:hypothetical protein
MASLKVVEMDRWEVSRLLRRVVRERHDYRRIYVMVEYRDGSGGAFSNMTAVDRLWWAEAHKRKILAGESIPEKPPGA